MIIDFIGHTLLLLFFVSLYIVWLNRPQKYLFFHNKGVENTIMVLNLCVLCV